VDGRRPLARARGQQKSPVRRGGGAWRGKVLRAQFCWECPQGIIVPPERDASVMALALASWTLQRQGSSRVS
jgi:hypothetical protein